jgi:FPC/CPF motif-containing protein YcgG
MSGRRADRSRDAQAVRAPLDWRVRQHYALTKDKTMKRYDQFCTYDGGGPAESVESPEGEWVRSQDAQAEISELRKDAERYRKIRDVSGALDSFTAAYHNMQTKAEIDAAVDSVPAVGDA